MPRNHKPSQISSNPFPYSSDNKRYHTFSWYVKNRFGTKTAKIPLNAAFTCPNRDGSKGIGGCTFCSAKGSGDSILQFDRSLEDQFTQNLERARRKWPGCLGIAYFQAFSNTYAPLEILKKIYQPFFDNPDVCAIAIATRADCFDEEKAAWFASHNKETWIEFGLQSVFDDTALKMNRGHTSKEVKDAVKLCQKYSLKTSIHLINGLPGETVDMMLESAKEVSRWKPDAVKIHMLHIVKGSKLAFEYEKEPFPLLYFEEYVDTVCRQLCLLDPEIIIERITGDGMKEDLIAPEWTLNKTAVANAVDTMMFENQWVQGIYAENQNPLQ